MSNTDPIPEGPPLGLTPILVVSDAHAAIGFYSKAFGATEIARISVPNSTRLLHVRMMLFGSIFVFMDEVPELAGDESHFHTPDRLNGTSVSLHLQVADAESLWQQAIDAGALPIIPLATQFWGELYGRLRDPFGHEWTIAQLLQLLGTAEVEDAAESAFQSKKQ
jgi:PhnB protein